MSPFAVHYVPVVTTVLAAIFSAEIFGRYREHPERLHLLWWALGIAVYGVGTFTEAATTIVGWNEPTFRAWYISGALLGGAPLAQGTVYLLLSRKTAHALTALLVSFVLVASVAVILSPIDYSQVEAHRLTGRVLGWQWVRAFSPFVNLYAVLFLIGGAVLSALRYSADVSTRHRMWANVFIAVGAILPGIGGSFAKAGVVEVLYVAECVGLIVIWAGDRVCSRQDAATARPVTTVAAIS